MGMVNTHTGAGGVNVRTTAQSTLTPCCVYSGAASVVHGCRHQCARARISRRGQRRLPPHSAVYFRHGQSQWAMNCAPSRQLASSSGHAKNEGWATDGFPARFLGKHGDQNCRLVRFSRRLCADTVASMTHPYLVAFSMHELHDLLSQLHEKFILAVVNSEPNRAVAAHHQIGLVRTELARRTGTEDALDIEPVEAAVRRILALTL